MGEPNKHEPIPLPPALLTVVPYGTMLMAIAVVLALLSFNVFTVFAAAILGFALPLAWLVKRTRR